MRIGMTCYPTYGGSGVVATELGAQLAKRGHEVHFISYAVPFRFNHALINATFHEVELPSYPLFKYPPYDLALACKMLEVTECHDLEMLHVHYAIPHAISGFLAREMAPAGKVKVITTLHGTDITIVGNDKSYFPVTRFGIEKSDGVTTVSTFLRDQTQRIFGTSSPIRVIPNFVDTRRFSPGGDPALRTRFSEPGEFLFLHMSNFRRVKRIPVVIRAFASVTRRLPSRLLMVGDGPERTVAENLVRELALTDRVHFLGQQDRVERIFQTSDIYLLPSEFESFGLSALEAMSCGVPVIGAKGGGLPELVIDGETGFTCEPGNAEEMGDAAYELLADPVRHERMRDSCRKRAVDLYDDQEMVGRYESFYEEVLSCR